jgi:hypothetical protein
VLSAACGTGGDPSAGGNDVASVLVASNGSYVGSAVVDAQGTLYLTTAGTIEAVTFQPSTVVQSAWTAPAPSGLPQIELALLGNQLYWGADDGKDYVLYTLATGALVNDPAPLAKFPGTGDVVGLVGDGKDLYAAIATPTQASEGIVIPAPDSWQWPGSPVVTTPYSGDLYRIPLPPSAPVAKLPGPVGGTTFFPGYLQHVLAQSATEVFWADSAPVGQEAGRVMAASKATWTTDLGHRIGGIQNVGDIPVGFVGLAATDTTVAWAAAGPPYFGSRGCWVWVAPASGVGNSTLIFDSTQATTPFLCNGVALDDQFVYVAMVEVYVPPAGPGSSVLLGKGIVRVPISGQGQAQVVPLQSDRWYGARRLLVDQGYVYAIDPSYVMRIPKSAFGP